MTKGAGHPAPFVASQLSSSDDAVDDGVDDDEDVDEGVLSFFLSSSFFFSSFFDEDGDGVDRVDGWTGVCVVGGGGV